MSLQLDILLFIILVHEFRLLCHPITLYRTLLKQLGSLAIGPLLSVIDTALVGRLGPSELGGLTLSSAIFSFAFRIFNFFSNVTGPIVARNLAAGQRESAIRLCSQATTLAFGFGILSWLGIELLSSRILEINGAQSNEPIFEPALEYLKVRAWGLPAALISTVGIGSFRGQLDTTTPLKIALLENLINLVLDIVLIFGFSSSFAIGSSNTIFLHSPAYGVSGAACATVIAEWFSAIVFLRIMLQNGLLDLKEAMVLPRWNDIGILVEGGFSQLIRTLLLQLFLLQTSTAATELDPNDSIDVAAHGIALQVWYFLLFSQDALAVAAQSLVARDLGTKDIRNARMSSNRVLQIGFVSGIVTALGVGSLASDIPHFFTNDQPVRAAASEIMLAVALMQPLNSIVFVGDGILQGAADFSYIAVAMGVAVAVSLGSIHFYHGSLSEIWATVAVLQFGRLLGFVNRYYLNGPLVKVSKTHNDER